LFRKIKKLPGENGEGKFLDFAQQLICYKSFLFYEKTGALLFVTMMFVNG